MRAFVLVVIATVMASPAYGQLAEQTSFSAERLRVAASREGILDVEPGTVLGHLGWDAGLWTGYASNPLVVYSTGSGKRVGSLVADRYTSVLVGAVGLLDRYELGVELPVVLYQDRPSNQPAVSPSAMPSVGGLAIGDVRLLPKVALLHAGRHRVDLAVQAAVGLPTGGASSYRGDGGVTVAPEIDVGRSFANGVRVAMNAGVVLRRSAQTLNQTVSNEATLRLGVGYLLDRVLSIPLEADLALSGATALAAPFKNANQNALEARGQLAYTVSGRWLVFAGSGLGLSRGYATPDWRAFAGVRFGTPSERLAEPEPEVVPPPAPVNPDRDGDGILDVDDRCPTEPGPAANHGCPDPDRDGDGIPDRLDKCPDQPEDRDGFEDDDGCPDLDNDGDGVVDTLDACPNVPGPASNHGCPLVDRDLDGVPDDIDNCPDEPGTVANHGCKAPQLASVQNGKIVVVENVYFETDRDVILPRSFPILDNIASILAEHQDIRRVRIEGHTDSQGGAAYNLDLSQRRAASVRRYLVQKGVDGARLEAQGFGLKRPISTNATAAGRALNRRVEFVILDENASVRIERGNP